MKHLSLVALLLSLALAGSSSAQDRVFGWQTADQLPLRLSPGTYRGDRVYHQGSEGGNMHINIQSDRPVTIGMAWLSAWNRAQDRPELMAGLEYLCPQQHVTGKITYECHLPGSDNPMILVIHDERAAEHAVVETIGAVLGEGTERMARNLEANLVTVTYYRWACVENCIEPEFQWRQLVREKYEITSVPKVYGLMTPVTDGQKVNVKLKSPVPMAVAVVPNQVADRLYAEPDSLQDVMSNSPCKQRGVQQLEFHCSFDAADGALSLVLAPEPGAKVPNHKKAEIDIRGEKCVANCDAPTN